MGLPSLLQEIEGIAGRDAALKLAKAKGGTVIFLPSPPLPADNWLVLLLGAAPAAIVAGHFAGRSSIGSSVGAKLKVPKAAYELRIERFRSLPAGLSLNDQALAMGLDVSTVSRYRKRVSE